MDRNLMLLVDYRGHFYSTTRYKDASMDVPLIQRYFQDQQWDLVVREFREIDFRKDYYSCWYVLYQSSEDRGLFYKSFIEDILLGLYLQGAVLIPSFPLFRAHHNKVFMEILRDLSPNPQIKTIHSKGYGTYEDFEADFALYPGNHVIKPAAGAMSAGVSLIASDRDKRKHGKRISRTLHLMDALKDKLKPYFRGNYTHKSSHRRKFIVQNYVAVPGHDFKVLIYGTKYYVLRRNNRDGDFRASGSGLFEWVDDVPPGLLDFSETVFHDFDVPYIALDVGFSGQEAFLFEMQFLHFGTLTIDGSRFYFTKQDAQWVKVDEEPILEREFVRSVVEYISLRERPGTQVG